ncbi:hypothetical protein LEP1GSC021_1701 [Leptospira noguchii str. 1993005606]|uniref:Uncharacterized protein n=2 Tax=Leptospira noguchii TaxID=28182 RepID=M6YY93_9LEPT|nr:hypothetical protein LEP1GSC035_0730 [Leptospira noguchii str. 2007001578]EMO91303.1 hypothetical protein LEP1GSC024_3062 [Leptospira noguchii str. 2001034031]EPE83439.1 hypothetical protein LEP1GSC021_1701 [Leptospira noguchii str. 1993005606]
MQILKNGNYKLSETFLQNEFNTTFFTNDELSEIQILQTDQQLSSFLFEIPLALFERNS